MRPRQFTVAAGLSVVVGVLAWVAANNLHTVCAYLVRSYHEFFGWRKG